MARNFRLYEKKRGNRRTGSRSFGAAGEAVFFAVFLLIGCGVMVALFATLVIPQWRVNHEFVDTTCTVKNTRVAAVDDEEGTLYRPEIEIEYHVEGERYRQWTYDIATARDLRSSYSTDEERRQQAVIDPFKKDESRPCWYDPNDPNLAVVVRGYSWWVWLVFIVPVSFIIIGAGGFLYTVFHWGKSAERCAAMVQRASVRELFELGSRRRPKFPNVPEGIDIANSTGSTLNFRLPIGTSPGWALFGTLLACLLWNGIVSVFVVLAVGGHLEGPDWFMALFITPFVLVGIVLVVVFFRKLLVTTGIGPTLVEISDHPLHPGDQCRLFVAQSGRLKFNALEVLLVCEEKAAYRQGTNTRTEIREVYQQEILRREDFEVRGGLAFETQCELAVPASAMHSFRAEHNEVNWTVVVKGDVAGWPDYRRVFPIVVQPTNGRTDT